MFILTLWTTCCPCFILDCIFYHLIWRDKAPKYILKDRNLCGEYIFREFAVPNLTDLKILKNLQQQY